jgi:hypothetical protein
MSEKLARVKDSSKSRDRELEVLSDSDNEGTDGYKKGALLSRSLTFRSVLLEVCLSVRYLFEAFPNHGG